MYTTLNKIRDRKPFTSGRDKLLKSLNKKQADDEPLHLRTVLDSNGLSNALWCLRAVDGYNREKRLFAVWCVRQIQHLITDLRGIKAVDVAQKYAEGQATDEELATAKVDAWAVSCDNENDADYAAYCATSLYYFSDWVLAASDYAAEAYIRSCWGGIHSRNIIKEKQETEFRRLLDGIDAGIRYEI